MQIHSDGQARIRHIESGQVFAIAGEDLDWQQVAADERQMGLEVQHEALIDHEQLGELSWSLWEYPVGCENMRLTNVTGHDLLEDLIYGLRPVPEDHDR